MPSRRPAHTRSACPDSHGSAASRCGGPRPSRSSRWWLASAQRWFPPQLVVPPERLAATLRTLLDTGELRDNLLITLHRLALGFAIGATGGAAFGILLARSRLFADYLRPTFDLLRQVPTLTLIPLLILLIGVDEPLKLVVVGKAVFFPVALAAYTGVHDAPRDLVEMARHSAASRCCATCYCRPRCHRC